MVNPPLHDPDQPDEADVLPQPASHEEMLRQLNEAETKANENLDLARRAQAELENHKRLAQKDIENAHKYSNERYIRELLDVFDNIDYSVEAAHSEKADLKTIQKGLELTLKILQNLLQKLNLVQIDPQIGDSFDPHVHEAMSMEESDKQPNNTIVRILQKGYQLHERIIRPARVIVSKTKD